MRALSSAGQSISFTPRGSGVRISQRPPVINLGLFMTNQGFFVHRKPRARRVVFGIQEPRVLRGGGLFGSHPHPTLTRPPLPSREREKRMAHTHPQRKPPRFSPSPDAYASPSPLKREGKKEAACEGKERRKKAACGGKRGRKSCSRCGHLRERRKMGRRAGEGKEKRSAGGVGI